MDMLLNNISLERTTKSMADSLGGRSQRVMSEGRVPACDCPFQEFVCAVGHLNGLLSGRLNVYRRYEQRFLLGRCLSLRLV